MTAFKMLPLNPETVRDCIQREIDTLTEYLEELESAGSKSRRSAKELQRSIKKLKARLDDTNQQIKRISAGTITWDELGIDALYIDEFHCFKNLYCPTKMSRVAGLPNVDSQRAFDCFMKVRSVLENGGRVVCATATPISNTIYCQIGSYRGFQILARRRPSLSDALFQPVEGFLSLPDGKLLYPFKFGDSDQGVIQSIDAQLRAIDSHLDRALKNRDELKHRQEVIERELASRWSYARKYEELQAQLRRVNQLLKEDGSQIDDKQEFAALDEDAFRHCEPDVEKSVQQSEEVSARLEITYVPATPAEPVGGQTAPSPAEEKESSLRAAAAIGGEPSRRQITLDDLRIQAPQTNMRKPSASTRAGHSAQLSLWK